MKNKVRSTVAIVVGAIGLAAAVVGLYQACPPNDEVLLVPPGETSIVLTQAQASEMAQPVVATQVVINEAIRANSSVYVVTNDLTFGPSGVLQAPDITIFATRIAGGRLDASGVLGEARASGGEEAGSDGLPGKDGSRGGSIFVAAARVNGTSFDASGGKGGIGGNGNPGRNGRNGNCDGFGQWVGAQDGGQGGSGGGGGIGGTGGNVTVLVPKRGANYQPPNVDPGKGGDPGQGGSGGRGGTGCSGLGGIQSGHPPGGGGLDGDPGPSGEPGTVRSDPELDFRDVRKALDHVGSALRDNEFNDDDTLVAVKQRLLSDSSLD